MITCTVNEAATRLNGKVSGNGDAALSGVAGLREARPGDLSFLANPKYAGLLAGTQASAVIVARNYNRDAPCPLILVDHPDAAFAQAALWFAAPAPAHPPGIHPSAVVAPGVNIGRNVHIGPLCVIEEGARIGDRGVLLAHCFIGRDSQLGDDVLIYPNVTVREGSRIGHRVIVHSSTVIGSDGFGYSVDERGVRTKVPQIGIVEIGDDVEIGACTTIDRARFGRTIIGNGVKIDNLVQLAHNCVIQDHAVLVAQVGISGSTVIGKHTILAGQTGVAGHLVIGDHVVAEGRSGITKDIPSGQMVYGYPAAPREAAARIHAHVQRLPKLKQKVQDLESRLSKLEASLSKTTH